MAAVQGHEDKGHVGLVGLLEQLDVSRLHGGRLDEAGQQLVERPGGEPEQDVAEAALHALEDRAGARLGAPQRLLLAAALVVAGLSGRLPDRVLEPLVVEDLWQFFEGGLVG